jgi:hypothetical protein
MSSLQSFAGRKLLQPLVFLNHYGEVIPENSGVFTGETLMAFRVDATTGKRSAFAITHCPARRAHKTLEPEMMKTSPASDYSPGQIDSIHEALLAYSEAVSERPLPEPYPNRVVRQPIPFIPSEARFAAVFKPGKTRTLRGGLKIYSPAELFVTEGHPDFAGKIIRETTGRFILEVGKVKATERKKFINRARAEVKRDRLRNTTGVLRCVSCLQGEIGKGEFVLCDVCSSKNTAVAFHAESRFDFPTPDYGAQDDTRAITVEQDKYFSPDHAFTDEERPLLENELATILAVKYAGFTVRNSAPFKKAQRATALLVCRFVFEYRFADIALIMPNINEKAATKFCQRARSSYWERYVREAMPEEARTAINFGLLRSIYPQNLNAGYMVRSTV